MGASTTGCFSTQAIATWAIDTPRVSAMRWMASTIALSVSSHSGRPSKSAFELLLARFVLWSPRACGDTPGQRAPGDAADALVCEQGEHLALLLAVEHAVLVLHGYEAR